METELTPMALFAENVGKRFEIYPSDRARLLEFLGTRTHHSDHWALKEVSFSVPKGSAFGVVGTNGAGKSTLLRVLAGITEPTEGAVRVEGRIATLLDLGVSFHESFTGRENVRLNCALLGLSAEATEERLPEILRFAELGAFIDHPVRTWSTGMSLRLGFSIAVHVNVDVLLVDEVLTVGDQYFQRKCLKKIEELLGLGVTLVLVTHDLHAVRYLCDQVMWLEKGRIRACGNPREVVEQYLELDRLRLEPPIMGGRQGRVLALPPSRVLEDDPVVRERLVSVCALRDPEQIFKEAGSLDAPRRMDGDTPLVVGTGEIRILRVQILDGQGVERERLSTGEDLVVAVTVKTTELVEAPIFGVAIFREDGLYVYGPNTRFDGVLGDRKWHGVFTFFVRYPKLPLLGGRYRISVAFFDKNHIRPHIWHNQLHELVVDSAVEDHGVVMLSHRWGVIVHYEQGTD
jgi:ABC-type polysaccharide/polyol phosphate transport system ATPase subunit